jgi:hypothetical protein
MRDKGLELAATMTESSDLSESRTMASYETIEVRKGPIDPSMFEVPAGYIKVESLLSHH